MDVALMLLWQHQSHIHAGLLLLPLPVGERDDLGQARPVARGGVDFE